MNRISKQIIVALLSIFGFLALMGIAGSHDYADEVVYTMSDSVYKAIVQKLGGKASNIEVAEEYRENRAYYDSLKY